MEPFTTFISELISHIDSAFVNTVEIKLTTAIICAWVFFVVTGIIKCLQQANEVPALRSRVEDLESKLEALFDKFQESSSDLESEINDIRSDLRVAIKQTAVSQ